MGNMSELIDTFNGNAIDSTKWTATSSATTLTQTGGLLVFQTSTTSGYATLTSLSTYDLTGNGVIVQLVSAGNQSLASLEIVIQVGTSTANRLWFYIATNGFRTYTDVASVRTNLSLVTYNPLVHKWLRIREAGGFIFWDFSANGGTWTNASSVANPFAVTALTFEASVGVYAIEASGSTVLMDNFNCGMTDKPGNYGKYVTVGNGMSRSEMAN